MTHLIVFIKSLSNALMKLIQLLIVTYTI